MQGRMGRWEKRYGWIEGRENGKKIGECIREAGKVRKEREETDKDSMKEENKEEEGKVHQERRGSKM